MATGVSICSLRVSGWYYFDTFKFVQAVNDTFEAFLRRTDVIGATRTLEAYRCLL